MKKKIFLLPCLIALTITTFLSCKKTDTSSPYYKNGCDVAEFLGPTTDSLFGPGFPSKPYAPYFKKTYDPYTNAVKEIDCSFFNANSPANVQFYQLLVAQSSNGMLLFLDKDNPIDTLMKVKFNNDGRVQSYVSNFPISADNPWAPLTNTFHYKNGRLFSLDLVGIQSYYTPPSVSFSDTFHYDNYGNILSHISNSYQYDHTRKAKQQFYVDDYMDFNNGFYLLEYMGLFPELTSPPNVRIYSSNVEAYHAITNQTFDSEGKLISYSPGPFTITWNCGNSNNGQKK